MILPDVNLLQRGYVLHTTDADFMRFQGLR